MLKRPRIILTFIIVFLAGVLLGFVPQYVEKHRLSASLDASVNRLAAANAELRLAQLRDLSGLMVMDVSQRNFGAAKNHATQYFEKARQETQLTSNSELRNKLENLLQQRDAIISVLAQGDPSSAALVESLFARTHEATHSE